MPRVALTTKQRTDARHADLNRRVADGLAVYKCRNRLTNAELGELIGVSRTSVSKILSGDGATMAPDAFWTVLEISGFFRDLRKGT